MRHSILLIQLLTYFFGAFAAPSLNYDRNLNSKIVGGKDAVPGQFPFMVSIRDDGEQFCGGSILNKDWVAIAAHCVVWSTPADFTVVAGSAFLSHGGVSRKVSKIIVHPNFSTSTLFNDIALMKLSESLSFNENMTTITIQDGPIEDGSKVTLIGWGLTSYQGSIPDNLQFINLKTISTSDCSISHGETIRETQLCTLTKEGEGACKRDSGGPLIMDGKLIGVVSWGEPCAKGYPDVFTRVSAFSDWIATIIE